MEQHGKDGIPPQDAVGAIGIGRAIPLGISLRALTIAGVVVFSLPPARNRAGRNKFKRIDAAAECQPKFLLWRKRSRVLDITGIEVWNDPEDSLMFLLPQLLLGLIAGRWRSGYGSGRGRVRGLLRLGGFCSMDG